MLRRGFQSACRPTSRLQEGGSKCFARSSIQIHVYTLTQFRSNTPWWVYCNCWCRGWIGLLFWYRFCCLCWPSCPRKQTSRSLAQRSALATFYRSGTVVVLLYYHTLWHTRGHFVVKSVWDFAGVDTSKYFGRPCCSTWEVNAVACVLAGECHGT